MNFKMSPGLWMGLLICLAATIFLVFRGGEIRSPKASDNDRRNWLALSAQAHDQEKTEKRYRVGDRPTKKSIRRFEPEESFDLEMIKMGGIPDSLFAEWLEIRERYQSLKAQGLGEGHPEMIAIGGNGIEAADKIVRLIAKHKAERRIRR